MDTTFSNDQAANKGWAKMWAVLKILFVVVCVTAFGWRATESFLGYLRGDVGTKVELIRQHVKDYPRIAACRHPSQVW